MDRSSIGVEQEFGWVITLAARAIVRSADPITVCLTRRYAGHEPVPHVAVTLRQQQLGFAAVTTEQAQSDSSPLDATAKFVPFGSGVAPSGAVCA